MVRTVLTMLAATTAAGTIAGATALAAPHADTHKAKVAGQSCRATGYEPALHQNNFVRAINNRYFPLPIGRTLVYRGIKDGKSLLDVVHVTSRTKVIEGITATGVRDISTHDGKLLEKTTDWYAQDQKGNVWYVGETTAEFSNGHIDRSGSWQSGVRDAEPGLVMPAHPDVPQSYRQECLPGQAEDMAWLVVKGGQLTLPFKTAHHVLRSLEYARIEPNVIDKKVYAPGLGIVVEKAMSGPTEVSRLVSVRG